MPVTTLNAKDTNDGWNGVSVVKGNIFFPKMEKTKEDNCKLKNNEHINI